MRNATITNSHHTETKSPNRPNSSYQSPETLKPPIAIPTNIPYSIDFARSKSLLLSSQVPNFLRNPRIPLQFGVGEAWNRHGFLLQGPSRGGGLHHLHGAGQVWERGAHQVRVPRRHLVTLFYPRVEFIFWWWVLLFLKSSWIFLRCVWCWWQICVVICYFSRSILM